jgi:hypothetical protein
MDDNNEIESKWSSDFEKIGGKRRGLWYRRQQGKALLDMRKASIPSNFDRLWIYLEEWSVPLAALPWAIISLASIAGSGLPKATDWQSFAAVGGYCMMGSFFSWVGMWCVWKASKHSWRLRWAGPQECRRAKSLASSSLLASAWETQARARGLRCIDVEAMEWLVDQARRASYEASMAQDAKKRAKEEQDAYAEINESRLLSAIESSEISLVLSEPKDQSMRARSRL